MANSTLPRFPLAPVNPAAPGATPPGQKGTVLAALLGITVLGAVGTMSDIQSNESGSRRPLSAYLDSVKIPTICDGIIRYPNGQPVRMGDKATEAQCDAYYEHEVVRHAGPLIRGVPQLYGRENQARALVDVSYNCGTGFVINGSIGRNIRVGNWAAAKTAIMECKRGTFPRVPANATAYGCVRHPTKPGMFLCTIRGLERRRERNQVRFAMGMPAQGVR